MAQKTDPPPALVEAGIKMLVTPSRMVPVGELKRYPKNPRVGNLEELKVAIKTLGFAKVLLVQKGTSYVLDGNQTWQAAVELGMTEVPCTFLDVDDQTAAKIVLAANRLNDLASYDSDLLAEVLKGIDNPIGTGYTQADYDSLVSAVETQNIGGIEEVLRPRVPIHSRLTDEGGTLGSQSGPAVGPGQGGDDITVDEDDERLDTVDGKLQGLLQLNEDVLFVGNNYYGIPDLARSMLLEKLPEPFDTWAGEDATPDDGVTTWLWNYGVASRKGLPADRAILCFYTYDHHFENWWDNPAFYTTKMINLGITKAVVPDFSLWDDDPAAFHIYNVMRAQWLGRFMQEAGIKIIPRLQFNLGDNGKSLDFCMSGIPVNPPILAASVQHTGKDPVYFRKSVEWTIKCLDALKPELYLVYGGNPAKREMEAVAHEMGSAAPRMRHVYNYAHKRRGVVYDKKEGLQGMKKAKKREERDKYAEDEAPPEVQEEEAPPAPRRGRRKVMEALPDDSDD